MGSQFNYPVVTEAKKSFGTSIMNMQFPAGLQESFVLEPHQYK